MSVLIKGMEMPMGCYECPFEVWGKCMFIHYNAGGAELSKKCPLIEVPPHGRLIDADELETDTEWSERYDDYTAFSVAQINAAPTIIESEEDNLSTAFQSLSKTEEGNDYGDICDTCINKDVCDRAKSCKHNPPITDCYGYRI